MFIDAFVSNGSGSGKISKNSRGKNGYVYKNSTKQFPPIVFSEKKHGKINGL